MSRLDPESYESVVWVQG